VIKWKDWICLVFEGKTVKTFRTLYDPKCQNTFIWPPKTFTTWFLDSLTHFGPKATCPPVNYPE